MELLMLTDRILPNNNTGNNISSQWNKVANWYNSQKNLDTQCM